MWRNSRVGAARTCVQRGEMCALRAAPVWSWADTVFNCVFGVDISLAASSVLSFMALSLAALSRVERLSPEGIIIRHTHKGDQPTQHCRVIVRTV